MHKCEMDHIVIVAPSLDAGAQYLRRITGVDAQAGGKHVAMGTHNLLLRLGPACYLEIIAVDPGAPRPARPRWFAMDAGRDDALPGLVTWVARTDNLDAALAACPRNPGEVLPMSRGALHWRITVPADGSLPEGGTLPTLIQWDVSTHPSSGLRDAGVVLDELLIFHPDPGTVAAVLEGLNFEGPVSLHRAASGATPRLAARLSTPTGECLLGATAD